MSKKLTNGINVDRLDQLVKDLGVRIRLFKSALLPDMKSLESMDRDLNTTVGDHNFVDFDCEETIALFQQQDLVKQFQIQGTFHIDEVLVTFLSGKTLAPFAKVEVLDFEEDFYELIQRQEATDIDVLKYKACDVTAIFCVVSNTLIRYHFGTDFILDVNGNIKWTGIHKPLDKQIYSVYYKYHPVYRAVKAVHRDRFSQFNLRPHELSAPKKTVDGTTYIKMPETWVLKRDYLVKRKDLQDNVLENEYYDPND